jgi:ubiquinone/menaquinone biosynthesis C-methylase UbiE
MWPLLAAELVRREGTVIAIDFNAELIGTARARVGALGLGNVAFVVGDAASVELDRDFDAASVGACCSLPANLPPWCAG